MARTDLANPKAEPIAVPQDPLAFYNSAKGQARLKARRRKERVFRAFGLAAVTTALLILVWLLLSLLKTGSSAFTQHVITLDVDVRADRIDATLPANSLELRSQNYRSVLQDALYQKFPNVTDRRARRDLFNLISTSGATHQLRVKVSQDPSLIGQTLTLVVPTSDQVDQLLKGHIDRALPQTRRKLNDAQILWVDELVKSGAIQERFNVAFFTASDSRDPELAGIAGAVIGSLMILGVAFILAFPIGVGAALYLDEFAPRNRWTDLIEININNLAAVPSIIFGLLGLALFLNLWGLPRSAALVGGMVLALRAFPTITIATRAALQSVPPSITEGALSVGASHVQAVFHHKLPLAVPGILTGTIIGMAQVIGETAPLLMIGMVAFVSDVPTGLTQPATALPVQIFLWSDSPEQAWAERTSAAILVLLCVLIALNGFAVWLRGTLEKRR